MFLLEVPTVTDPENFLILIFQMIPFSQDTHNYYLVFSNSLSQLAITI